MRRNIIAIYIIIAVIVLTLIPVVALEPSTDNPQGKPFQEIWDEIASIWIAIADLQTQECKCDITRAEFDSMTVKLANLEKAQECISGATIPCGSNVGECKQGTQTCVNYHWSTDCVGEVKSSPETCDSKDNDCNGAMDDGLTQLCPLQQGVCSGTTSTCADGTWPTCDYGSSYQVEETLCDGKDNDCDGQTDEGFELGGSCGIGKCNGGTLVCNAEGTGVICSTAGKAISEFCNGIDDDCDGPVDEDLGSTTCGLGVCTHTQLNCVNGVTNPCNPYQGSGFELCDGKDNNCDGFVDNQDVHVMCPGGDLCHHPVCTTTGCSYPTTICNDDGKPCTEETCNPITGMCISEDLCWGECQVCRPLIGCYTIENFCQSNGECAWAQYSPNLHPDCY